MPVAAVNQPAAAIVLIVLPVIAVVQIVLHIIAVRNILSAVTAVQIIKIVLIIQIILNIIAVSVAVPVFLAVAETVILNNYSVYRICAVVLRGVSAVYIFKPVQHNYLLFVLKVR